MVYKHAKLKLPVSHNKMAFRIACISSHQKPQQDNGTSMLKGGVFSKYKHKK